MFIRDRVESCTGDEGWTISVGDSRPAHEVDTFPSRANDLHLRGIFPVVDSRDRPATWSTSIHSVG